MDMLKQPDVDHDERMDQFSTAKSHDDDDADDPNGVVKDDNPSPTSTKLSGVGDTRADRLEEMQSVVKKVVYESRGPLYMDLCSRTSPHLGALVKSFRATADGGKGQAELSGNVHVGDLVLALNDVDCTVLPFQRIVLEAKNANFPLVLQVLPKVYVPEYFPISSPSAPVPHRGSEQVLPPSDPAQPPTPTNGSGGRWGKFGQILDIRPKRSSLTAAEMPKGTIPHSSQDLVAIPTTTTGTSTPTSPSPSSPHTLGTIPISSVGWAATPPAPQHQQPQPVTPPPGTANDKFQQKFKHWQDSITLDKVVASSSSLFKFIGGSGGKSPSAADHNINDPDDEWAPWLAGATIAFREPGNPFHTSGLHLVSASKPMGVQDGQVHCQWYRVVHPNHRHWLLLQGATQRTYMPSIDDVGVTVGLSCHISRLGVSSPVKLIELTHPLVIDPSVEDTTRMMVEAGSALFSATLASSELVSFQLKVNSTHVVVIQISEDDFNTVVDAPYDGHLHVYLDPEDSTRFILRFRPSGDAVGTCDTGPNPTIHQATLATLHLTAQSASTRDIIASTVRTFRANRLSADADASARDVEANYFGEVVDKAKLTAPAMSLFVSDKTDGDCPSLSEDVQGVALVGDGKSPPVQTITATADEVAILKKQLASQALLLKATQNERNFMAVAVEVRERKLEDQAAAHKLLQATVDTLRGELQVAHATIARTQQVEANAQQMERSLSDLRQTNQELEAQLAALRSHDREVDAKWAALDEDCRTVRAELAAQQALYMTLVEERNALKAKTTDLSKELRRLLKHGQSVGDLEAHLIERTQLQIDLAEAKADVKRYVDEMNEFKNALDCHVKQRGMGDVEMQRVLSQNKELQRLVAHFSTSLSASQDQVAKWKKLFDSSPLKHVMTTQRRLSKSTSFQQNEQLVFDEDDEEEDEEEEE